MSSGEVRDVEVKLAQTFSLGQPDLVSVVLEAYRDLVSAPVYQEALLAALSNSKFNSNQLRALAACLRYAQQRVENREPL